MLPIKKIYVDSRFKTADSASHTDFKIDLPGTFLMPENTAMYITDVTIPASWYTVDENKNNKIFYMVYRQLIAQDANNHDVVSYEWTNMIGHLSPGSYNLVTLAGAIESAMESELSGMGIFTVKPSLQTNRMRIQNDVRHFRILTDAELPAHGFTAPYYSINTMIQNDTAYDPNTSFVTGYVNLFPNRNLYIVSPNLGKFDTMSVSGERKILKKVPVNAGYNEMIYDQTILNNDYIDCSRQLLGRLEFQLKDLYGNVMDLQGNYWSFSLLFTKVPEV